MGVSTDAMLWFGYCWGEEREPRWPWEEHEVYDEETGEDVTVGEDMDAHDWLSRETGGPAKPEWNSERREYEGGWAAFHAWQEARDAHLLATFGAVLRFDEHGADSYRCGLVAIDDSFSKAGRGYPQTFRPLDMVVPQKWLDALAKLLELTDIEAPDDAPRWWLASWWG